jgi:hypothetical protein
VSFVAAKDMVFANGMFKPTGVGTHNQAGMCVQAAPAPPPPPKPPGWSAIPLPSPAQLAWSRHEITAIGHFLPLCGHGDMQKPDGAGWESVRPCMQLDTHHTRLCFSITHTAASVDSLSSSSSSCARISTTSPLVLLIAPLGHHQHHYCLSSLLAHCVYRRGCRPTVATRF